MAAIIRNNAISGINGNNRSGGYVTRKVPFGYVTVQGGAGDVARIPIDALVTGKVRVNTISVQKLGTGPVNVQTTLVPIEFALDPNNDSTSHWQTAVTVSTGVLTNISYPTTALLITFTGAATLFIGAA